MRGDVTTPCAARTDARKLVARDRYAIAPRSPAANDLHASNHIAFEYRIDDVHAANDLAQHGVVVIETPVVDEVHEDLRVSRIATTRRDPNRAAFVRPESDLVAHEAGVTDVLVRAGTSALDHEVHRIATN